MPTETKKTEVTKKTDSDGQKTVRRETKETETHQPEKIIEEKETIEEDE